MTITNTDPTLRAAGVLLIRRCQPTDTVPHQFLLMRHPDRWDLPKGHADGDETFLETAMREMTEETGIEAAACDWIDGFQFDLNYVVTRSPRKSTGGKSGKVRTFQKQVRYFLAWAPLDAKLTLTEHESFRWWDWQPPHQIQSQTIDPLLAAVAEFFPQVNSSRQW